MLATRCARTKCSNRTTCQQSGMPERQYLEPTRSRAELRIDVSTGDRVTSNYAVSESVGINVRRMVQSGSDSGREM